MAVRAPAKPKPNAATEVVRTMRTYSWLVEEMRQRTELPIQQWSPVVLAELLRTAREITARTSDEEGVP